MWRKRKSGSVIHSGGSVTVEAAFYPVMLGGLEDNLIKGANI